MWSKIRPVTWVELRCTYDPESRGGRTPDGRKVRGTLHWVSAQHAIPAEVRLYDRLFTNPNPNDTEEGQDFLANLNPDSLTVLPDCMLEPNLETAVDGDRFQFMRQGYFIKDSDSTLEKPVYNLIVGLRDTWAKMKK